MPSERLGEEPPELAGGVYAQCTKRAKWGPPSFRVQDVRTVP